MGQQNFQGRTLFIEDDLNGQRGMNSNAIDLIHLDPPQIAEATTHAKATTQSTGTQH